MADSDAFKDAAQKVRDLDKTPSNEDYAKLYSLFKQATSGDCNRGDPGSDGLEKAKYDAWMSRKGMSREEAAAKYIEGAKIAVEKYGLKK